MSSSLNFDQQIHRSSSWPKLYIPSTLNIDLILWHTQLNVCAENVKSWVFPFTFQAYILPHTLNCMYILVWVLKSKVFGQKSTVVK